MGGLGAWMTFKKAKMVKSLRNGLSMIETNPSTTIGWILRFSWGWHCTSFKKTAVKNFFEVSLLDYDRLG